jgi:NTE family protein
VAASCAVPGVWPPVTIGDRRFLDGGIRSVANADLAAGHDRVVVVLPLPGFGGEVLAEELDALERAGGRTLVLSSDDEAAAAMGANPLDPARRAPSAVAGRRQAAGLARRVRELLAA